MFVLWRSRLAQSGVPDRQAADSLIFALQTIPQLAHLADKCKDMLGKAMHIGSSCLGTHWVFLFDANCTKHPSYMELSGLNPDQAQSR